MKNKNETFASLLEPFLYQFDLPKVFDDFLTMSLCAVTRNFANGLSHYEDLYLKTIEPYKENKLRFQFPKMLDALVNEMEARTNSNTGNDVLGEYYEQRLPKKKLSQFFTPWPICTFMAKSSYEESDEETRSRIMRILDPSCGSGRMLLAAAKEMGKHHAYFGIDIDQTCVKMTALNLFLNGVFRSEVMCANALLPEDFKISYGISILPIGIFRIEKKENSPLWNYLKRIMEKEKKSTGAGKDIVLPSKENDGMFSSGASQLTMF